MSYHDPLTGLGNRNRYVEQLQKWQKHPLSQAGVLVCDVNGLKQLNELYGHHYGDQVLIELARILNLHARPDQLFRLGGDEFIAVYEEISYAEFQQRLARLKNAFTIIVNGVSMGSSWSGDEPDINALMNHADQLMYIAKQNYYKTTYNLSKHYRPETYQQVMEALKEKDVYKRQPPWDGFFDFPPSFSIASSQSRTRFIHYDKISCPVPDPSAFRRLIRQSSVF